MTDTDSFCDENSFHTDTALSPRRLHCIQSPWW